LLRAAPLPIRGDQPAAVPLADEDHRLSRRDKVCSPKPLVTVRLSCGADSCAGGRASV